MIYALWLNGWSVFPAQINGHDGRGGFFCTNIRLAKSSTSEYNHGYGFVGGMLQTIETYLEA